MELPSVSVVVPALNEAQNIPHVFAQMPPDVHEVVLVDGFSVDETVAVARQLETRCTRRAAVAYGQRQCASLRNSSGDWRHHRHG